MDEGLVRLKSFPRYRVIGRELFACLASEVDLWEALGPPTSEVNPPLGQGDPQMFWDIEFACGLVMGLQLDRISERLTGYLDQAEVKHVLRHLAIRPRDLWLLEEADPSAYSMVSGGMSHDFRLWEQEGSSEPELLGAHLAERDARCQLADLDGIEPGVKMWVDRDEGPAEALTDALAEGGVDFGAGLLDELADDPW